ncbi:MAG: RnfH family protein [Burkholderiales bacterium]|nr:RnfH family protein [Burkholderiales bacterium]
MKVSVVFAAGQVADVREVDLPDGATARDAVVESGLADRLDPAGGVAIWNRPATPATALRDGDRVELLRPLQVDPKLARQRRVAHQRRTGGR